MPVESEKFYYRSKRFATRETPTNRLVLNFKSRVPRHISAKRILPIRDIGKGDTENEALCDQEKKEVPATAYSRVKTMIVFPNIANGTHASSSMQKTQSERSSSLRNKFDVPKKSKNERKRGNVQRVEVLH